MSTTTLVLVIALAAIVALVFIARGSGPRITTIERRTETKDEDDRDA